MYIYFVHNICNICTYILCTYMYIIYVIYVHNITKICKILYYWYRNIRKFIVIYFIAARFREILVSSPWRWSDVSAETCGNSITDITINHRTVHLLLLHELSTYVDQCAWIWHGADNDSDDESSEILLNTLN